ncbi:MAG TPA: MauE/DoxX family redox-associated membrane protein [Chloroflexota bacterium]|nr:MauE/DoxX family redox-associated membrane protein [Chloroflexota bacterium]
MALIARLVLATTFAASALSKLHDTEGFRSSVAEYGILGRRLARSYADSLPWIELAVGVGMLVAATARVASVAATALLLSFAVAATVNLARGRDVPCACFGQEGDERIGARTILRQAALFGLAAVGFLGTRPTVAIGTGDGGDTSVPSAFAPAADAATAALVFAAAGLLFLLRRERRAFRHLGALRLRVDSPADSPGGDQQTGRTAPAGDSQPGTDNRVEGASARARARGRRMSDEGRRVWSRG